MSKLISIIIPVYNAEKFLHECLNSLINQTFKNFEEILVFNATISTEGFQSKV